MQKKKKVVDEALLCPIQGTAEKSRGKIMGKVAGLAMDRCRDGET